MIESALAFILLVGVTWLTCQFVPAPDVGLDGPFYLHLAHHVARGHGLVTSISLYHQGLAPLPQPSTVYPVWPWVLGASVHAFGLEAAGRFTPKALYVLDTALAYVVLARVSARLTRRGRVHPRFALGLAHLGAAAFALNPVFFWATSLPYSEGLTFAWLLLALLAVDSAARGSGAVGFVWAGLAGLLAAAAYLTRFQAVGAPFAVVVGLGVAAPRGRRLGLVACAALAAAIPMLLEAAALSQRPHFEPAMLLDFAAYRQIPELPPFNFMVSPPTWLGWLLDRAAGLLVAFDPASEDSYFASFGALALAPPLAAVLFAAGPKGSARGALSRLREPEHAVTTTALLLGVLLTMPVHAVHSLHWKAWLFGWRHGLTYGFLTITALAWMLADERRLLRGLGLLLAGVAIIQSADGVRDVSDGALTGPPGLREAAAFLDSRPGSTALAAEPQRLAVHTDASLYWAACWTPPDVIRTLRAHVRLDYLLLRPHELACPAFRRFAHEPPVERLAGGRFLVYDLESTP